MCFIFEVEYIIFFMYTNYVPCAKHRQQDLFFLEELQKMTSSWGRLEENSNNQDGEPSWLGWHSSLMEHVHLRIRTPYPHGFHGQPSSELDRIFGRCGCCQSAEGPVELMPWGELAGSTKSRPWPYKNHEKSWKIEGSFFFFLEI